MRLYLMRHGHSPSAAESGVGRDEERPLSVQGREAAGRAAQFLAAGGESPAMVRVSPLRRAQETAEELNRVLRLEARTETWNDLAGIAPPSALWEKIKPCLDDNDALLLIGHMPQMGSLAQFLSGQGPLELRPAGVIALEAARDGAASLLWSRNF
ncbi:MAG: phosphohistidine phosphatase SixA [Elusimicrobia bacterium]|nr:phosphohistidine phosphatase SixA [Elusimicrobiota bacterium]